MIERGPRDIRPFGLRRADGRADPRPEALEPWSGRGPEIPGWDAPRRPSGPLPWALRTAAIAGLGALFAAQYLVHLGGPDGAAPARMARGPAFQADPETTGSIARPPADAARATRLDPCAAAPSARPPRP